MKNERQTVIARAGWPLVTFKIALGIIVLSIFAFFIYGQFFTSYHAYFDGYVGHFDGPWTYTGSDGNEYECLLPASLNIQKGDTVTLSSRLPSHLEEDQYLCFLGNRSMNVYINGNLRFSFDSSDNPLPGGYVKSHYMLVGLNSDDAGGKIDVECCESGVDNTSFNSILLGDKSGIIGYLLRSSGTQFLSVAMLFIISLVLVVIVLIIQIIYRKRMYLFELALGIMLLALWFMFDSFFYQIAMRNYYVDGPMEYMMVMIIPFFFLLCLDNAQSKRHEPALMAVGFMMIVADIATAVMHFSGYRSFQDNLPYLGIAIIILLFTMIGTIIADIVKKTVNEYILLVVGFLVLFAAGIAQAIKLLTSHDEHSASPLIIGMYLMLVTVLITLANQVIDFKDEERYLKKVSDMKSAFLANMSHEIRTPVNAILGMNELIRRESTEKEIRRYSENISGAGENLLGIINDILDISKIESGKMELLKDDYRLSDLVINITNQIRELANKKNLEFKTEVDPKLPDNLNGDGNRLGQILINLLSNAVKYTEKGSVHFKVGFAEKDPENSGNEVRLKFEVRDTGIGIRSEDIEKLFDKFERLELSKNKSIEGTGLGLAITHDLVRMMGGDISVDSLYGEGSTFTATVVQSVAKEGEVGDLSKKSEEKLHAKEEYRPLFAAPEAKLLVVDDSPVNIMIVKGLLKQTDIRIDQALSGQECLDKCAKETYDMILLDHMMPKMDGIETLRRLKDDLKIETPVVALTANAIEGVREMYLKAGFSDYLTKPTKPEDLERTIKAFIPEEKIVSIN